MPLKNRFNEPFDIRAAGDENEPLLATHGGFGI
jgi:hypothetical protein